ncbi:MAG TPA: acyl-CoA dehydrogenase family protein [Myxococcota bacterium]|nr:acyl-CoA dehydrogenase family protein [Myxococcota bacterium]
MNDASPDPMQAAHALAPELRARAEEIEAARRLPRDLSDRFAAAGFYRLLVPEAYGGLERPPREAMEIFEVLARADGASAWCAFIGATSGRVLASLPEATARAVFREPTTLVCGAVAPRGRALAAEGGVRVTGRWAWGSGIANADWVLAGCAPGEATDDAGTPPRPRLVLVPAAQVEILDTWHVSGLAGTGSTDFALEDVFVPASRIVDLGAKPVVERPLYAFPQLALLGLSLGAIALGLARAAIDELIALAGGKTPQGSSRPLAARAHTQSEVALAEAGVRSARAFYLETIDAAWTEARARGVIPVECRRDLRLATTHAARASAEAIDRMYHVAGGSSVYLRSPLQRHFRDVHVLTQHMMVAPPTLELTGRLLLGLETDVSTL